MLNNSQVNLDNNDNKRKSIAKNIRKIKPIIRNCNKNKHSESPIIHGAVVIKGRHNWSRSGES